VELVETEPVEVSCALGPVIGLAPEQPAYRLLIAEDQAENRMLLRKLLEPLGFELREAVTGQEAVDVALEWRPDLIWMDMRMPVMDGLEASKRIKSSEIGATTAIVALTAHALEEERAEILASGCDDFVRKPYRESDILDALARQLGVAFVYGDAPKPSAMVPDAAELATLPEEKLEGLELALTHLDEEAISGQIECLRADHPSLSSAMSDMARDLQYGRLLRLVRAARSKHNMEQHQ
jgi:CheY-like chemotaxis protein